MRRVFARRLHTGPSLNWRIQTWTPIPVFLCQGRSSSPSVRLFSSDLKLGQGAEAKQDCWESAVAALGSRPSNVTVVTDQSRRTIKLHIVCIKRFRAGNPSLLSSAQCLPFPPTHLHFPAARLFLLTDANIHMLSQTFCVFLTSADRYLIKMTEA